jgi:ATP-binding protein involved in chromosome partitioning
MFANLNQRRLTNQQGQGLPKAQPIIRPRQLRQAGLPQKRHLPGVKKVIAVSSAKGGVGKSTLSANLALAFARDGLKTGILDTDIFGPSIPRLFDLQDAGEPRLTEDGKLIPLVNYGVKTMSMGYLVPQSSPIVWRGLMVMKALQQLLHEVEWGGLDIVILDLPPGTGDVQLTITQQVILDGAVIVSTPQDIALADAIRGVNMFRKVEVPLLGMVQNMSVFVCPKCGEETHVFGQEGVDRMSKEYNIDLLGNIPLDAKICEDADRGKPTIVAEAESARAQAYVKIKDNILRRLEM